jgi:hypothetical protein
MKRLISTASGVVPLLVVCLASIPPAHAQLGIFNTILSTIETALGGPASDLQKIQQVEYAYEQATIWPESMANTYRNMASELTSSYRPWMNEVYSMNVNSATVGSDQSLEQLTHSADPGNIDNLNQSYATVYGGMPSTSAASPQVRTQIDALDSTAQASDALSIKADQASTNLISESQALSDAATRSSQGDSQMVAAEAAVLQLQSVAIQHQELAAILRNAAAQVANQGALMKDAAAAGSNASTQVNSVLHSSGGGN